MPDPDLEDVLTEVRDLGLDNTFDEAHRSVLRRLDASIGAEPDQRRRWLPGWRSVRPHQRVVNVVGVAGAALCLSAAGYAVITSPQVNLSHGIACYSSADRSGGVAAAVPDGRTAIEICAQLWRDGQISPDRSAATTAAAPTLQACVDPTDRLAIQVIPSETAGVCARYGLVSDPDAGARGGRAYATLTSVLDDADSARCLSLAGAEAVAQQALADASLTSSWTVRVSSYRLSTANPCMQFGNDDGQRIVDITPGAAPIDNPGDRTPGR